MTCDRVVLLNLTRLGDLIQTTPLIQCLRHKHPNAQMVLVTLPPFYEMGRRLEGVDHVVQIPADAIVTNLHGERENLRANVRILSDFVKDPVIANASVLYNLSHTLLSARLCRMLQPGICHGLQLDRCDQPVCLNDWIIYLLGVIQKKKLNPFNLAEIYWRCAGSADHAPKLGVRVDKGDVNAARAVLRAQIGDRDIHPIVLHPGASRDNRCWPATAFGALAASLTRRGLCVVITGSAGEQDACGAVHRASGNRALNLAGKTDIGALSGLLSLAQCVVANDTGVLHLAAAVGTPTVGVYVGPASAKDTGPFASGHWIVEPDLLDTPCDYRDNCGACGCAGRVSPEQVELLVTALLDRYELTAEQLHDTRVFRTLCTDSGEYHAIPANRTCHASSSEWLTFYRYFWLRLLDPAHPNSHSPAADHPCLAHPESVTALRRQEAELHSLLLSIRSTDDVRMLPGRISNRLSSMNQAIIESAPELLPFTQFIERRHFWSPKTDWETYLTHTQATVTLLSRGINWIRGLKSIDLRSRRHEVLSA